MSVRHLDPVAAALPSEWMELDITDCGQPHSPAIKAGPFGSSLTKATYSVSGFKVYGQEQVIREDATYGDYYINAAKYRQLSSCSVKPHDVLMSLVGTAGKILVLPESAEPGIINPRLIRIRTDRSVVRPKFLAYFLQSDRAQSRLSMLSQGGTMGVLNAGNVGTLKVPLPAVTEQDCIVAVLDDMDTQIRTFERTMRKKRDIRQGMMQELLTGRTRLPGYGGAWTEHKLKDVSVNLDSLRVPVSEADRSKMPGPYPYCGANGVLDHVSDYVIDDDVILLAEDGGNFEEFATRAIAYRMSGKIWVNNHAHVLKGGQRYDTGFLFHILEHKDIRPFISSGTRSKLTRAELDKIDVRMPEHIDEQRAIAAVLDDANHEAEVLQARLAKALDIKTGMMQELLTGRTRLVPTETRV